MQTVGKGKIGVDGRASVTLRRGVLQVGIAVGTHAYRHVLLAVLGQNLRQGGSQQHPPGFRGDFSQLGLQS